MSQPEYVDINEVHDNWTTESIPCGFDVLRDARAFTEYL
jgi:hypothetical protein